MIKILSVDTCSKACSASVHYDDVLIGETFLNTGLTHSQTLMPAVDSLLKFAGIKVKDIDLFGVTKGPGSFTGLRIGMASVKGMALPFNKPCAVVSSLYAMAMNAVFLDGIVCCCMDARNKQIYGAVFRVCGQKIERLSEDRAILIDDFVKEISVYDGKIIFVGDAAEMCYNTMNIFFKNKHLVLLPGQFGLIRASKVGEEALKIYNAGGAQACEEIVPEYLKLSQAERELKNRQSGEEKGGI